MPSVANYQHAIDCVVDRVVQNVTAQRMSPCATYRLQFHAGFTFRDAAVIVPYLRALGISHVYASPYARARAGSTHGYDVCDHNQLNSELGGEEGYREFIDALRDNGLRHVLDVVPNHMAATADNPWWRDVLENGPNSPYSGFFDIDWRPVKSELENKVLIPVLGAQYGEVLEAGQLQIEHTDGGFIVKYFDQSFPFGPKAAIPLLSHRLEELRTQLGAESESVSEYQSIITALEHLPPQTATTLKAVHERQREKEVIKRRLRELETREPAIAEFVEQNTRLFNGRTGDPESFDRLDRLLQAQPYRLCHWRAASDEINYRRFFDINDLAALCIEKPDVFYAANELVARLLADGLVDGLRIDHVDGLYAPEEYLWRLQYVYLAQRIRREWQAAADHTSEADIWEIRFSPNAEAEHEETASNGAVAALPPVAVRAYHMGPELLRRVCTKLGLRIPRSADLAAVFGTGHHDVADLDIWPRETFADLSDSPTPAATDASVAPLYLLVEKILGPDEPLPDSWPVAGTTGYDFTHLLNSLFISPEGYAAVEKRYLRFTGESRRYPDVVRECKRMIVRFSMASELQMLAHRINRLSEQHRKSRDFTLNALRYALREVLASFPVYRTYPGTDGVSERDQRFVNRAVAAAKRRNHAMDPTTFDFIRDILLLRHPSGLNEGSIRAREEFAGKFQQVASPVMAKGVEDTAFYAYSPLASANEVGGDLSSPTCGISRFHAENANRSLRQRCGLLTTTTHDTKRTEDVRARIHALSEIPKQWAAAVSRWSRLTRGWRRDVDGVPCPRPEDEYHFYQNLLGIWPESSLDEGARASLTERLQNYMEKATREAKQSTSWVNPNAEYDQAMRQFVAKCLEPGCENRFLAHFTTFHKQIVAAGYFTALSQTVLKLLSPGVPDIYQGQELWEFSLVDPDNRRPVDYDRRRTLLRQVHADWITHPEQRAEFAAALVRTPQDERLKLFVTWRLLKLRSELAEIFLQGDYIPLSVSGAAADHVIAFAWRKPLTTVVGDDRSTQQCPAIIVVAPRFWAKLATAAGFNGIVEATTQPEQLWGDTHVDIPGVAGHSLTHVLTAERHKFDTDNVPLAQLLSRFPTAILADERIHYP